jgi:hypothetical protein
MAKMAQSLVVAAVLGGSIVGSAFGQKPAPAPAPTAQDCAAMIKRVRDQVANRFDSGRHSAVTLAGQAEALQKDNKPADCMAKAQEAAKAAGVAAAK